MGMVHGYLREHFPEASTVLDEVVQQLQALESAGRLPADFWEMLALGSGPTVVGGVFTAVNISVMRQLSAKVACPTTVKMAKLVKVMGPKGTKVMLYAVLGASTIGSLLRAGLGVYITADTLLKAKRYHSRHKDRERTLRIRDLVAEGRVAQ